MIPYSLFVPEDFTTPPNLGGRDQWMDGRDDAIWKYRQSNATTPVEDGTNYLSRMLYPDARPYLAHHEQSDTVKGGNGWQNVYGEGMRHTPGVTNRPGEAMAPLFPFEQSSYQTEGEAVQAARRRSDAFGAIMEEVLRRRAEFEQMMGSPLAQALQSQRLP